MMSRLTVKGKKSCIDDVIRDDFKADREGKKKSCIDDVVWGDFKFDSEAKNYRVDDRCLTRGFELFDSMA